MFLVVSSRSSVTKLRPTFDASQFFDPTVDYERKLINCISKIMKSIHDLRFY